MSFARPVTFAAAILAMLLYALPAAAQTLPDVCKALPIQFADHRAAFLDDDHRSIARALKQAGEKNNDAVRKAIVSRVRARIAKERQSKDSGNVRAAILEAELVQYYWAANEAERAKLWRSARDVLTRSAQTPAAAEALMLLAGQWFEASDSEEKEQAARQKLRRDSLAAHQRHFGTIERQYSMWHDLYDSAETDAEKLGIAREYLTAARGMASTRVLFEAQLRLFHQLPTNDPMKREVAAAIVPTALEVARTPLLPKGVDGNSCYGEFKTFSRDMVDAMTLAASAADKRQFIKLAVPHMARLVTFETHVGFIFEDVALVIAAREVDHDAFVEAMSKLEIFDERCKLEGKAAAVCGLLNIGRLLVEMTHPALGIMLLEDAQKLAAELKVHDEVIWQIRLDLAEAEWRHGQKARAAAAVAAIDPVRVQREARFRDVVAMHRLRAEVADALLDPQASSASMLAAMERVRAAPRAKLSDAEKWGLSNAELTVEELIFRHLRRRLCVECGEQVRQAVAAWIKARPKERLIYQKLLPRSVASAADTTALERAFLTSLGAKGKELLALAKRRLPKGTTDSKAIQLLAVFQWLQENASYRVETKHFDMLLRLVAERDADKSERIWRDEIQPDVFERYQEDGYTERYQLIVEAFAYHLEALGERDTAAFVLDELASVLQLGPEPGSREFEAGIRSARQRAAFWTEAFARLAALDAGKADWKDANEALDIAREIANARLEEEWATSADRVAFLLRELRPGLQLLARTRARVATSAPAAERKPDKVYEELQLAMLGETAASLQAAQRRRLTAEPLIAEAVARRETARARVAALQAFDDAVRMFDEAAAEKERTTAARNLEQTSKAAEAVLPEAETLASLKPLSLAQTQSLLAADEAVLLLHAGDDAVYGLLAGKSGAPFIWRSPVAIADLEARIASVRKGLNVVDRLPDFPLQAAHDLYRLVLGPAAAQLQRVRGLLVVADGPLLSFPMAALPTEMPRFPPDSAADFRSAGIKWLGLSHAITYLPTARALDLRQAKRLASRARLSFAGIGNPVLGAGKDTVRNIDFAAVFRQGALADVAALRRQAALPETETEIRAIGKLMSAREEDLFLGARATEPLVRSNGLGDYRIIMFATHGLLGGRSTAASEPGLVLTPPDKASTDNDGFLSASEIASLKLDADLVILSACNTAASDGRPRAEGFSGLTRAFLSAGARNVIVTHWAIPSEPTVHVTTRMMAERDKQLGLGWSEALRRSFVAMVESEGTPEMAHPSNWAAFTVVGVETAAAK